VFVRPAQPIVSKQLIAIAPRHTRLNAQAIAYNGELHENDHLNRPRKLEK
jgi:hypothetical protein